MSRFLRVFFHSHLHIWRNAGDFLMNDLLEFFLDSSNFWRVGRWWSSQELPAQYLKFYLFTVPEKRKCTSLLVHTILLESTAVRVALQIFLLLPQSAGINSWAIIIFSGCNLWSECKMRLTIRTHVRMKRHVSEQNALETALFMLRLHRCFQVFSRMWDAPRIFTSL